ncbi:MAG TPA: hypothetical protein VFV72_03800 [Candidatus Limnocylindrales bacterium]|nr:hypothetical protein [Candidatus Limnocylindrales bacterium]
MGFAAWILTGIVVGGIAKLLARSPLLEGATPSLIVSTLAALLGGFVADLFIHGDAAVANFRGPSVIGAVAGSLVALAITIAIGWPRPAGNQWEGRR